MEHERPEHLERVTNLIFQLVRQHLPLNRVQDAVAEARHMRYNNKSDPFYMVCEELSDNLLNL